MIISASGGSGNLNQLCVAAVLTSLITTNDRINRWRAYRLPKVPGAFPARQGKNGSLLCIAQ